jgi:glucokinase
MAAQQLALGVDIGGSALRVAATGDPAHVSRAAIGRATTVEQLLTALGACVAAVARGRPMEAMAVAIPSFVRDDGTVGECPAIPALTGVDLRAAVSSALAVRVEVVPDLAAAAVGEYRYGSGRGVERFLCVALGTGANAAAIVSGRVVDTAFGCLGDAGHVLVEPDGPECACGGRGCLEAMASGWALQQAAIAEGLPVGPALTAAALDGDERARELYVRAGVALGRAISSWSVMIWPDLVAVAGGVSAAGELLLTPARAELIRIAPPYVASRLRLVQAELGDLATLTGACHLAGELVSGSPA